MTKYECDQGHLFHETHSIKDIMNLTSFPPKEPSLLDILNSNTPIRIEEDLLCPVCLKIRLFDGLGLCEEVESEEE